VVAKWVSDAAQKAASEPNSGVTFELLSGKLTVDASTTVAGVKITGGEVNLYQLAKDAAVGCVLTDVAIAALMQAEVCLRTLFGLG
jgi:hypothetical protein